MELFQVFDTLQPLFFQFGYIIFIIQTFQDLFVTCLCLSIHFFKIMKDITYTYTVTTHFISISRTYTFSGSSHFGISFSSFISSIQNAVSRQNQMSFLWNVQTFFQGVSASLQSFSLSLEQSRIQYHTITNNVYFISLKYSGRNGTEHIFLAFEFQCMACIRTSLETSYYIITGSQNIDNLSFAFITPLQT